MSLRWNVARHEPGVGVMGNAVIESESVIVVARDTERAPAMMRPWVEVLERSGTRKLLWSG